MFSINNLLSGSIEHGKTELHRLDYLDGWRGLAILFVLISHFIPIISGINLGRLGVDIFFVLSGLLMSKILFIRRVPLNIFYKRRISRIFPVLFIFVTTMYLSSYIFELSSEHENYFYSLFFLRTYFPETPDIVHTGIAIGHLWSLNVEEHCYMVLSVIAVISFWRKKEFIPLLILGCMAIAMKFIYMFTPQLTSANYDLRTEVVASHLLISAGYFLIKHHFTAYVRPWMPIVTFSLAVACYLDIAPWYSSWLISPFLLAFTVNHLDQIPEGCKRLLSIKPLRLLGVLSYSIYLWQQPFYYIGVKEGEYFPFSGLYFLLMAIIVGALSFYKIENPIRRYLNDKW
ncbi:MAG: acyltransferase [Colwellia sp.]|nr:acyltransferase [Colwellia sp.]